MVRSVLLILIIPAILLGCSLGIPNEVATDKEKTNYLSEKYFPTKEWRFSSPEAQGMDSGKLIEVIKTIDEWHKGTNSVVVIRNGYIVAEKYYGEYAPDIKQVIFSATKSIMTGLVGIAVDQGIISINDNLLEFFDDKEIKNIDEYKRSITIENLLTMRSGFEYSQRSTYSQIINSDDPVQFILDLPMKDKPNTSYDYNDGNSHLLSAIIQEKTGKKTVDFAMNYLFKPLNIEDVYFAELNGVAAGGNGLMMRPRDMAKIGYLYLNKGNWDGKQIISEDWIKKSITPIDERFRGGSYYGYQWYIDEINEHFLYYAQGAHGQYIYIIPELEMVIVFTSSREAPLLSSLTTQVVPNIINSVVSNEPIDENQEKLDNLHSLTETQIVREVKAQQQPKTVNLINNKTYKFETNDLHFIEMDFSFNNETEGQMEVTFDSGNRDTFIFGINNVPLRSETSEYGLTSIVGTWENDYTLVLDVEELEYSYNYKLIARFSGEQMNQVEIEYIMKNIQPIKISGMIN